MEDIQSLTAEIRQGKKKERKKIEITQQKYNGLPYYIGHPQSTYNLLGAQQHRITRVTDKRDQTTTTIVLRPFVRDYPG